jgi:hypothetical protein
LAMNYSYFKSIRQAPKQIVMKSRNLLCKKARNFRCK